MPFIATAEQARNSRRYVEVEEGAAWVRDYFGRATASAFTKGAPAEQGMDCPQAFLVEQQPNQVAPPHFHLVDQFQIVVGGDGAMGKHAIAPVGVHYANAYTTYGPLAAGPEGLHYITMRNRWDCTQAHFMPKSRAILKDAPRRHLLLGSLAPARVDSSICESLHALEPDGLAVWRYRVPTGARADGPDPKSGGGQYWLVLAGELQFGGANLEPMSCVFLMSEDAALEIMPGSAGVELLALQFPALC